MNVYISFLRVMQRITLIVLLYLIFCTSATGWLYAGPPREIASGIYIPGLDANVTADLRFYECGKGGLPQNERIYQTNFPQSTSRYIGWEINLTHPAPAKRVDFTLEAIFYNWDNSILGKNPLNTYFEPGWTSSIHSYSFGWENPGNWPPGKYRVEVFFKGQKLNTGVFEITGKTSSKTDFTYIPLLTAYVTGLKFYEGTNKNVPYKERVYKTRFSVPEARYIFWELNLEVKGEPGRDEFEMQDIYYDPEGKVLSNQTHRTTLQVNSKYPYFHNGYGWTESGNWKPGTYRVEILFNKKKIASGTFELINTVKPTVMPTPTVKTDIPDDLGDL